MGTGEFRGLATTERIIPIQPGESSIRMAERRPPAMCSSTGAAYGERERSVEWVIIHSDARPTATLAGWWGWQGRAVRVDWRARHRRYGHGLPWTTTWSVRVLTDRRHQEHASA